MRANSARAADAIAALPDPQGRALSAASNGSYTITQPGTHRVQLISPANQTSGYSIRLGGAAAAAPSAPPPSPAAGPSCAAATAPAQVTAMFAMSRSVLSSTQG